MLEGGSNDNPSGGTPGFEHPGTGDSTNTPPSTVPVALPDILNREATQEEVDETINGLLETYPQYNEQELLSLAEEASQERVITVTSLEELEAAIGAHAAGIVTGEIQPSSHEGHDFETVDQDGNVTEWDVKSLNSERKYNLDRFIRKTITNDINAGEHIVFNTVNMSEADIQALEQAVIENENLNGKYVFYPER